MAGNDHGFAEKRNNVYFPGGNNSNHVQRLNTSTRECETIKILTFAPRCLVAHNGWLCCGSETGEFVAIRLDEVIESTRQPMLGLQLDAETRHRLGLDGPGRGGDEPLLTLLAHARRSNKSLVAKSMKLAKDRINCVTLWFPPPSGPHPGTYTEPVAVLANNDKTVLLVSLGDFDENDKVEPLEHVEYPDFVNRAIISPDGRIMVAILDDPYLYVHGRTAQEHRQAESSSHAGVYRWEQKQRFLLKSQRKDDRTDSRGSFAACFSPSGAYLAVGTQHGTISIFDTTLLLDSRADPLITTFQSSRPESGSGAVRDMAFCPGPFDILAWTEDRGRVGFADMRSNFMTRQIVDISVEAGFQHIDIFDRNTIDPRLLENNAERRARSPPSGSSSTTRARRPAETLENLNQPLTANETIVLEAIQGDRRRRERAGPREIEGRSRGVGGPSDLTWTYLSSLRSHAGDGESPARLRHRSSSTSRAVGDILGSYREQRERQQQERLRNARQPVRDGVDNDQTTPSPRRPDQRWMDRIGETVAAMRDQREGQDSSYLHVLEMLQARDRPFNEAENEDSSFFIPMGNQAASRWEESAIRGTLLSDHGYMEVPSSPDNTSGLTWTEDGRTLFVGAQNGIYEMHINVHGRKFCPSIKMS
ncbi:hypothetical protein E4U53_000956 [Claviceps sorghi]|nr:hypothetical protein E4U53_000956 [Claviceps sorghi]